MVNKKGAFIVSKGLADVTDNNDVSDSVVKANVSEQKQPSYPASSSGEQPSLEWLNAEIARLEDENEKLMTSLKQNKKTLSDFKQLVKDKVIEVNVRMLSGRSFQVQTKSGKTVKQFKTQDLDAHYTYEEHLFLLVIGGQVLQNNKRLHSYGVCVMVHTLMRIRALHHQVTRALFLTSSTTRHLTWVMRSSSLSDCSCPHHRGQEQQPSSTTSTHWAVMPMMSSHH